MHREQQMPLFGSYSIYLPGQSFLSIPAHLTTVQSILASHRHARIERRQADSRQNVTRLIWNISGFVTTQDEVLPFKTHWLLLTFNSTGNISIKVTLRSVRVTIGGVDKHYYMFWVCVCMVSYPACNAHAPYWHLCSGRLCNIFPHYLINCTVFGGGVTERKMCFFVFFNIFCPKYFQFEEHFSDILRQ